MPNFDLTITITSLITISAIISPIITCGINNHYQMKLKQIELSQLEYERSILHKREIFESYLKYLNAQFQNPNDENLEKYAYYYPLASLYVPSDLQLKMSSVNKKFSESTYADVFNDIEEITIAISDLLQTMSKSNTSKKHKMHMHK